MKPWKSGYALLTATPLVTAVKNSCRRQTKSARKIRCLLWSSTSLCAKWGNDGTYSTRCRERTKWVSPKNKRLRAVSRCTEDTLSIILKVFICYCVYVWWYGPGSTWTTLVWRSAHIFAKLALSIHPYVDSCDPTSVAKLTQWTPLPGEPSPVLVL